MKDVKEITIFEVRRSEVISESGTIYPCGIEGSFGNEFWVDCGCNSIEEADAYCKLLNEYAAEIQLQGQMSGPEFVELNKRIRSQG